MRLISAALLACVLVSPVAIAQTTAPSTSAAEAPHSATGQWRASKLVGVDLYNEQNENIGEVDDVIIDPSGKVDGVIVSVGGFLGMGEHHVLMKIDQIKFSNKAGTTSTTSTSSNSKQWYPDRGTVNVTKDQLKAMPEFKY
jgi:sporulation protein YlmC with PRC-barrel domain